LIPYNLETEVRHEKIGKDFGFAVQLLFETNRGAFSVAAAYLWLMPAINLRQIKFIFRADGRPAGYVTWGYVSDTILEDLAHDRVTTLDGSDWNEGLNLWIFDVVASKGFVLPLVRELKREFQGKFDFVNAVRKSKNGLKNRRLKIKI
jgi:cytolysin-activating lysine-acyltransferase